MAGPEATIERWVCNKALRSLGIPNQKMGQDGWPDRIFMIPLGKPLFIEFKAPGEELKPRQVEIIKILRTLGYNVAVHDDKDRAFEEIARALESARLSKESGKVPNRTRVRRSVP